MYDTTLEHLRKINLKDEQNKRMIIENPRGMSTHVESPQHGMGTQNDIEKGNRDEKIFIADTNAHKLYKFDITGKFECFVGGCGERPKELHSPKGVVAIDNHVFVCDQFNRRVQCFKCTDLTPCYSIDTPEENLCPIHIAACTSTFTTTTAATTTTTTTPTRCTTLFFTGTNKIYICDLLGTTGGPHKVRVVCMIKSYKEGDKEHEFDRIGGIAVSKSEASPRKLIVTETFQNSVLVLNLDYTDIIKDVDTEEIPVLQPKLKKRAPSPNSEEKANKTLSYKKSTVMEFQIKRPEDDCRDNDEWNIPQRPSLMKPHPVVEAKKDFIIVSTDSSKETSKLDKYDI